MVEVVKPSPPRFVEVDLTTTECYKYILTEILATRGARDNMTLDQLRPAERAVLLDQVKLRIKVNPDGTMEVVK